LPPAEVAADLLTLLLVDLAACGSAKLLQKRFLRFALEFRGLLKFFHAIGVALRHRASYLGGLRRLVGGFGAVGLPVVDACASRCRRWASRKACTRS
jgi:hypothetical protein